MRARLKASVINMKTLSQDIDDPIIINRADAEGRTLEIIFTQEAAARFTPHTKVYLSWRHIQQDVRGYNVFTEAEKINEDAPPRWFIHYPHSMLYEGDVVACIELVDEISIAASTNFVIHVLQDPDDGTPFVVSDDYTIFQQAVIDMNSLSDQVRDQMDDIEAGWEEMQAEHEQMIEVIEATQTAVADVEQRLEGCEDMIFDLQHWQNEVVDPALASQDERITRLEENTQDWSAEIESAKQDAFDYTDAALTWNVLPHTD